MRPTEKLRRRLFAEFPADENLLTRFRADRDAVAFECLVWRHGGLVLGICRRMLRNEHAAEDAFQTTFLALARGAKSIRGPLAPWLHSVARRVCTRIRKRKFESLTVDPPAPTSADRAERAELRNQLDSAIARLPEKLRRVTVLCYLEELTTEDAAQLLGIPRGTVLSRLDAARKKLTTELKLRGLAPTVLPTVAGFLAFPDSHLVRAACRMGLETATDSIPTPLATIAREVLLMPQRKWIALAAGVLFAFAGAGTGWGVLSGGGTGPLADGRAVANAEPAPPAAAE